MDDVAFFSAFVEEQYGSHPVALHPVHASMSGKRRVYRVTLADGRQWVMKARRSDLEPFSPPYDLPQWVHERASVLLFLEELGHVAPRVIRTCAGAVVGVYHDWYAIMITFIEGTIADLGPERAHGAGQTLAQLHAITTGATHPTSPHIGRSWWHPAHTLVEVQAQLAGVADGLPSRWKGLHHAFGETLNALQMWSALPQAIIHTDCWAGNVVQTIDDQLVLIDWDTAGLGPIVLDLGDLLIGCHIPLGDAYSCQLQPDPSRITAVVDGYVRYRVPTPAELDVLDDAVRYGAVFRGARTFARVRQEGWTAPIERELERQCNRYLVSAEIARIAHARFTNVAARPK